MTSPSSRTLCIVKHKIGLAFITLNHSAKHILRNHKFPKRETSRITREKTLFAAPDSHYVINPASTLPLWGFASIKGASNGGEEETLPITLQHKLQHPIDPREEDFSAEVKHKVQVVQNILRTNTQQIKTLTTKQHRWVFKMTRWILYGCCFVFHLFL